MKQHGLTEDGEQIVIHRFHGGVETVPATDDSPVHRFLVIDLETTGLGEEDRIIELAAAEIDVQIETGLVVGHHGTASWLEDPGRPIPPEIVDLTGIRDRDVRGKAIPDDEIRRRFDSAKVVVAHNARFDRAMARKRFPWIDEADAPPWACSLQQIPWKGHGHRHANLENLAMDHGFFYSGHRATIDVEALIKLLALRPEPDAPPYFCDLVADVRTPYTLVAAVGTPFEAKDDLRMRGYRWDAERKQWYTSLPEASLEEELEWIAALCDRFQAGRPAIAKLPFSRRFDDSFEPTWHAR